MSDPVTSCLSSISPSLATLEGLKVLLGWDPVANRDIGWLTLTALSEISDNNLTAMTDTGLVFRRWNSEMGPYLGRGRLEKLEKKVQAVLDITPNRNSWQIFLGWDSSKNMDVGWFTCPVSQSTPQFSAIQLRRWNLTLPLEPAPMSAPTSLGVSPPSSFSRRHHSVDSKMPFFPAIQPIQQNFSRLEGTNFNVGSGGWSAESKSVNLPQLVANQQKEGVIKEGIIKESASGQIRVECHLCGKFFSQKGLGIHIFRAHSKPKKGLEIHRYRRAHSNPNNLSTASENSVNSPPKLSPAASEVNNNQISDVQQSVPDLSDSKSTPNLGKREVISKSDSKRIGKSDLKGVAEERLGKEKCSIIFEFETRKLKLTTLVNKNIRKAMMEFAKHRALTINQLEFQLKTSGERLDPNKIAGDYNGQIVLASRI